MAEGSRKDLLKLEESLTGVSSVSCLGSSSANFFLIISLVLISNQFVSRKGSLGLVIFAESKLFVCKKDDACSRPGAPLQKPAMFPVLKSQGTSSKPGIACEW